MEFDDITITEYRKKQIKKKIFWITFLIIFLVISISLICAILLIPGKKGSKPREWLESGINESGIDNVYKINLIGTNEVGVFGKEYEYICFTYEIYRLEDGFIVDEKFDDINFDDINFDIDFYKSKVIKYVAFIWFKKPKIQMVRPEDDLYDYCIDFDIARILE